MSEESRSEEHVQGAFDRLGRDAQRVDVLDAMRRVEGRRSSRYTGLAVVGALGAVAVVLVAVGVLGRDSRSDLDSADAPATTAPASTVVATTAPVATAALTTLAVPTTTPPAVTADVAALPEVEWETFEVASGPLVVRDVADDDVLNLRSGPGVEFDVVATAANGATLEATGRGTTISSGATWVEVQVDGEFLWVNGTFLGLG